MRIKSRTIVQLTKLGCALKVNMVAEFLTHVRIHADMMEKIVTLENVMVLDHPKVEFIDKRLEKSGRDVGVVVRSQRIANIVQQSADDI